jgi:phospholipase A1
VSRYFELEPGTDCGTFNFRGYRPMSVSVVVGDEVNQQPYSPSRGLATEQPYQKHEMRLQLSARTKIASGLLTGPTSKGKDSLWFGYTQQSYWQLFNGDISRPSAPPTTSPRSSTSTRRMPSCRWAGAGATRA